MRTSLWIASFLAGAVVLACGQPPPPPPPDPPRVTVVTEGTRVADVDLDVDITVSGCATVRAMEVWDRDHLVATPSYGAHPTRVKILPNQLRYRKLADDLSLVVKVQCDDGRTGQSTPASVRYLPVQSVVRPPATGGQVVTDVFYAEGIGANAGFIGCSGGPNGTTHLVRVDQNGTVTAFNAMLPFHCSANLWMTELNLASGKRWAVEPGVGAIAFDALMNITAVVLGPVTYLGVGPDGDAVVYMSGGGTEFLRRISHENGAERWSFQQPGVVIGNPVIQSGFGVFVPVYIDDLGAMRGSVSVQRIDYELGTDAGRSDLRMIQYAVGDAPPIPAMAFNADGSIAYLAVRTRAGATTVLACSANVNGCASGGALRWQSASLPADVVALVPFASHDILAAIAPRHTWFLDADSGNVLSRDGKAISPEGALVTVAVQPGRGRDFYLLNGSGQPGTLPVEVVAVDDPVNGELFRFGIDGAHLMAGVDDGGQLWLRIGGDLVKPLPLIDYARALVR